MIVIISDHEREKVGTALYQYCLLNGLEASFVSASTANVKPCLGCQGCTFKTFGKCIFRDDMDQILPILLQADCMVLTCKVTYGGLSYAIKKILDKAALIGDMHYYMKSGEMTKGRMGNITKTIGIGVEDGISQREKNSFVQLLHEICNITRAKEITKVVSDHLSEKELTSLAEEVFGV